MNINRLERAVDAAIARPISPAREPVHGNQSRSKPVPTSTESAVFPKKKVPNLEPRQRQERPRTRIRQREQPVTHSSRSLSPSKQALPRFYTVRLSDKPVFLRRTTVRPPSLSVKAPAARVKSPALRSPTRKEVTIVSRSTSPVREFFIESLPISTSSIQEIFNVADLFNSQSPRLMKLFKRFLLWWIAPHKCRLVRTPYVFHF